MGEDSQNHYQPLTTREVKTENLDGGLVDSAGSRQPFSGRLPSLGANELILDSGSFGRMMRVSPGVHGRTMVERVSSGKVVWGGPKEADVYGARDQKGGEHSWPIIEQTSYGSYPFRVKGGLNKPCIQRVMMVSGVLRNLGLPTSRVTHYSRLLEIAGQEKNYSIEDWRYSALVNFEQKHPDESELVEKAREFVNKTDLYLVERELQVPERIRDLARCRTLRSFDRMVGKTFDWLNVATKARKNGLIVGTPPPEPFSIRNEKDIERYLAEWLPSQMGIYLGRVHQNGIILGFTHAQNWSMVGTYYDLDSVAGTPLSPSEGHLFSTGVPADIRRSLGTLEELFGLDPSRWATKQYGHLLLSAKAAFIKAYEQERWPGRKELPAYEDYLDASFTNGKHPRVCLTTPEQWVDILELMGVSFSEDQQEEWERAYQQKVDYYAAGETRIF